MAGLNVGGIAHLRPSRVRDALAAIIALVARGSLQEPAAAIEPVENAASVHRAIEDRTAPSKTLLSLSGIEDQRVDAIPRPRPPSLTRKRIHLRNKTYRWKSATKRRCQGVSTARGL